MDQLEVPDVFIKNRLHAVLHLLFKICFEILELFANLFNPPFRAYSDRRQVLDLICQVINISDPRQAGTNKGGSTTLILRWANFILVNIIISQKLNHFGF